MYVLDFLDNHPLCPEEVKFKVTNEAGRGAVEIFYGGENSDKRFFIPQENVFFNPNLALEKRYESSLDIFETIFFHISRFEEVFAEKNQFDEHGRLRSEEMFLVKNNLDKTPVVDHLVVEFFEKLGFKIRSRPTEFHMSHDIDILLKFHGWKKILKAFGSMLLKQHSLSGFRKLTKQYFQFLTKKRKDPFDTFDWLFTNRNFKTKTVYILPEGTIPKIEKHFKLNEPKVREMIALARLRGYEIGLHPSYEAGFEEPFFLKEKEALEKTIGNKLSQTRQHFLRWNWKTTPQIIQRSGLKIDSTLGFSDRIGFRCGTGFPYRLYDFENERPFDFFEIPMIVMDVSLLRESENPSVLLHDFLNQNQMNTAITFNFHNSAFDEVYVNSNELKNLYLNLPG